MILSYNKELIRKLLHSLSAFIALLYMALPQYMMLRILTILVIGVVYIDYLRISNTKLAGYLSFLQSIIRHHEKSTLSGASYVLIASLFTILLFKPHIAIIALLIMSFADTAAALVGKRFTPNLGVNDKTWQGSLAFLSVSILIVFFTCKISYSDKIDLCAGILAAVVTTIVEIFSHRFKLDDNLTIPLSFGIVMTFIISIFGI